MSVKGVGRGGKSSGPRGSAGARGAAGPAKASGAFGAKVEGAQAQVGPEGAGEVGAAGPLEATDPVTAQALELIRQLKTGQLKSRDEATRKLVSDILRQKVRTQSKHLTDWIVDQLKDDPGKNRLLEQLWKRAEEKE
jgi:hypothetical protein